MLIRKIVLLCLLCVLNSACAIIQLALNFSEDSRLNAAIIDQSADAFPEIDTLALNQEIIDFLDIHVTDRTTQGKIVERLQELLFGPDHLNIQYDDQVTRTAIETFALRQGNCLSVVSLYIAMARHLGVDAEFQTVKVRPRWDRRGELLVLSQHINAMGRLGASSYYVVDFTPEITVQQLTAATVSDNHSRALYFNNLGVESLIMEDFTAALRYFKNALWVTPSLSIAWNNIGTAYSRTGDKEMAEYAYRKSYALDRTNATAINNLVKFYTAQGDVETAERYARAIERFNKSNPYYHYAMGNLAYANADFELAESHFKRAIRRKNVEPDFYIALSSTYEKLGNPEESARMFEMARLLVIASDQIYLPSRNKVRIVDENSILRPGSSGFSVRANPL